MPDTAIHEETVAPSFKGRILIIDDEADIRESLETLLEIEGYLIELASNAAEGLDRLDKGRYDLVLLDLMMPDLGGVRVLEELRDDPELAEIPVIVVTGKIDAVPGMRALLGDNNVFVKPFAVAELLSRVGEVTGGPVTEE